MTTSFAAAADGAVIRSFLAQPFGAFLAFATSVFFWGAVHVAVFGSMLGRVLESMLKPRPLFVMLGLFLLAWAYKVLAVRGLI